MASVPEYVPPQIDIDLMRHQIIDGEVYVNLDDLVNVLTIQVQDLDKIATFIVNVHKQRGFALGGRVYEQADVTAKIVFALKNYAETIKFDSIVNGEENEQE